jgi:hypothetical protein
LTQLGPFVKEYVNEIGYCLDADAFEEDYLDANAFEEV